MNEGSVSTEGSLPVQNGKADWDLWDTAKFSPAYGRAEQPLAQIEFSVNCNNPDLGISI